MAAADDASSKRRSFRWWPIWIAVGVGVAIAIAIAAGTMQFMMSPQDRETETARDIEPGIQEGPGLADRPLVGDQLERDPEFENQTNNTAG